MKRTYSTLLAILTTVACLTTVTATAQKLQASLSHYSTDNGLSSNAIAFMTQDDYGYIWIATWNGLSRFDGFNFYNYRTGNGSRIPNLHNRIYDIAIDQAQNVWMRMYDGRVFVVNRKTDQIMNPLEQVSDHQELKTFIPLTVTSGGDVLASFDGVGIYKMRLDQKKTAPQLITTPGLRVTSMAEGYHDDIWVGTDKGVHRLDIANLSIEQNAVFANEHITHMYSNGYNIYVGTKSGKIMSFSYGQAPKLIKDVGQQLTGLYVDNYGVVWYSDQGLGIYRYRPASDDTKFFVQDIPVPEYDATGTFFNNAMGLLWIRMNHGGYGYYNREADEIEYFHNDPSNPWNLSNTVNASLELEEGVVWESTRRRGLEKLEIKKNTITRSLLVPDAKSTIDNEVRAMYYDKKRKLLLMGNKKSNLFIIHPDGSQHIITHDSKGNPIGRAYGIMEDSKGNYWLSSKDYGLSLITPQAGGGYHIQNFRHDDQDEWSISSNAAYQAVEDKQGNIWVATYGGGVNLLVRSKGGHKFYHPQNVMHSYPANSFMKVRAIARDKDGNIWAGTTDGILIMSYKNNNLTIRKLANSTERPDKILMSTDIVCLNCDQKGTMWVGTNGGGLSHTIGRDSKGIWLFDSYTSEDGLPSDEIKSITFDLRHNVWFATDHVLCSFDIQKKIFSTFGSLDGVDETTCSESAAITLPNGNILMGTVNGYYTIDLKKLTNNNGSVLKLRFTDFYLNDQLQTPRQKSLYDYYVPEARKVVLPDHSSVFSFRFASLNYQMQHRVHYQYMLEGYDTQWHNADKTRTISYSTLPTGSYHLKVKAFLIESPDMYDMRSIEIVVPPYFLLSRNAIWLYLLLTMFTAIYVMLWRQKKLTYRETIRQLSTDEIPLLIEDEEGRQFMDMVNSWLGQNYHNPGLKIEEAIAQSNMSKSNFHRLIEKLTGQKANDYIDDFRLRKAAQMMRKSDKPMAVIVEENGFKDIDDMTRIFKSRIGLPPERYRRESHNYTSAETQSNSKSRHQQYDDYQNGNTDVNTDVYEIIED